MLLGNVISRWGRWSWSCSVRGSCSGQLGVERLEPVAEERGAQSNALEGRQQLPQVVCIVARIAPIVSADHDKGICRLACSLRTHFVLEALALGADAVMATERPRLPPGGMADWSEDSGEDSPRQPASRQGVLSFKRSGNAGKQQQKRTSPANNSGEGEGRQQNGRTQQRRCAGGGGRREWATTGGTSLSP